MVRVRQLSCWGGPLAHPEEQGTFNPKVPGSRPGRPTSSEAIFGLSIGSDIVGPNTGPNKSWDQPLERGPGAMAGSIRKRPDKGSNAFELRVYLGRDDSGRVR